MFDLLKWRSGYLMAKKDVIELEGTVVENLPNAKTGKRT